MSRNVDLDRLFKGSVINVFVFDPWIGNVASFTFLFSHFDNSIISIYDWAISCCYELLYIQDCASHITFHFEDDFDAYKRSKK